jgi:hypothetical protein
LEVKAMSETVDWIPDPGSGSDPAAVWDDPYEPPDQAPWIEPVDAPDAAAVVPDAVLVTDTAPDGLVVAAEPAWRPADFDGIGMPIQDAAHWHPQQAANSCAIVTQGAVLESVTGIPCDEARLTEMAVENGWYDPERGTAPADVGRLLEAHGVPCEQQSGADISAIVTALERGDKVMVGLDGGEIAAPLHDASTGAPLEQPDALHSVWVTGIDTGPDGSVHVLVNDPGHPGGQLDPIELHDFLNAWDDTGNHLTVARTGTA